MDSFSNQINDIYIKNIKSILDNISNDYNLDKNELYKYLDTTKKQVNKLINKSDELCMARKQDGNQCSRRKKYNDYCGKHVNNQKFGRVDDSNNLLEDFSEDDNYIMVWKEKYQDNEYLVDSNNIVYTNSIENPKIIGKKINNNLIEFI